jgi:hypothetical protein
VYIQQLVYVMCLCQHKHSNWYITCVYVRINTAIGICRVFMSTYTQQLVCVMCLCQHKHSNWYMSCVYVNINLAIGLCHVFISI